MELLLQAMRDHPENAALQLAAKRLLAVLSADPDACARIVAAGGIPVLLAGTAKHLDKAAHVQASLAALAQLARASDSNVAAIAQAKGVEITLSALKAQPANAEVAAHGLALLSALAAGAAANCDDIKRLGGVPVVLATMSAHALVDRAQVRGAGRMDRASGPPVPLLCTFGTLSPITRKSLTRSRWLSVLPFVTCSPCACALRRRARRW